MNPANRARWILTHRIEELDFSVGCLRVIRENCLQKLTAMFPDQTIDLTLLREMFCEYYPHQIIDEYDRFDHPDINETGKEEQDIFGEIIGEYNIDPNDDYGEGF